MFTVIQVHVTWGLNLAGMFPPGGSLYRWSERVWFGMDLFFVMSGFLIGSMLLSDAGVRSARRIGRFYARRSFRIFPQYYATLTVLALITPLTAVQRHGLIYEYTYLTNYHLFTEIPVMHWAWSLCVEEHFYLAVPLLVGGLLLVSGHRGRLAALGLLWASALGIRLAIWVHTDEPWNLPRLFFLVYERTHVRYDTLIAGIGLAYIQRQFAPALRRGMSRPVIRMALWGTVAACLAYLLLPPETLWMDYTLWHVFAWGTVTSVMWSLAILGVLNDTGALTRFLSAPIFLRTATLGYGVYLVHIPVLQRVFFPLAHQALGPWGWSMGAVWVSAVLGVMVVSNVVSYGMHIAIDKPFLWLRDRLAP